MLDNKPVLAISACLAGEPVRYDGATKRFKLLSRFEEKFELKSFCPELAIGMGVPRQTLRLVEHGDVLEAQSPDGELVVTQQLQAYAREVARHIEASPEITGYVVCKGSPSCGFGTAKRYRTNGYMKSKDADGVFTAELARCLPWLPIEDDGRLNDRGILENFLTRVFVMQRWRKMQQEGISAKALIGFHQRHKFLLLAHNQKAYRQLGPMLANLAMADLEQVGLTYISAVMDALAKPANHGNHTNVLMHLQGFIKSRLASTDRQELADLIVQYRQHLLPRQVPVALLKHHLKGDPKNYLNDQYYFDPFPQSLLGGYPSS